MKKVLYLCSLLLSTSLLVETIVYEVGNELVSKKRTSPVVLFYHENDLVRYLQRKVYIFDELNYGRTSANSRDVYQIEKGDKIRLLESLRNGDIFRVQLLSSRKSFNSKVNPMGSYYYFVESKSLKHFSLIQSEPPLANK